MKATAQRYCSVGVMLIGMGLALVILLTFTAGLPEGALDIGGGLAALGAAVFFNGVLMAHQDPNE